MVCYRLLNQREKSLALNMAIVSISFLLKSISVEVNGHKANCADRVLLHKFYHHLLHGAHVHTFIVDDKLDEEREVIAWNY